jgi:hypothetical protein
MSHRYEFTRAAGEKSLMLIFAEGAFESLPFEVRLHARWTGHGYRDLAELKPADRRALLATGYAIVRETLAEAEGAAACAIHSAVPAEAGLRRAA